MNKASDNWVYEDGVGAWHRRAIKLSKDEAKRVKGMKVTTEPHPTAVRCVIIKYK